MEIGCQKKTCHGEYDILGDISYETPDNTSHKSVFDLYLPRREADPTTRRPTPPVVVFVHGGGWRRGDKDTWKHFIFQDINLLAAFFYWCYGLYGNVGREFARRGVPCAVTSYPLTKLKTPWLLLELTTSYLGTVVFLGSLMSVLLSLLFVIDLWTSVFRALQFSLTLPDLLYGHLVFVNLVTLVVISLQRSKHELPTYHVTSVWIVILSVFFAATRFEHYLFFMFLNSFVIVQCFLLYLNLRSEDCTHEDQIAALSKCIKKVCDIGRETRHYDNTSVYLIGHSAGGHLCSLIALRPEVLAEVGVELAWIKVNHKLSTVRFTEIRTGSGSKFVKSNKINKRNTT